MYKSAMCMFISILLQILGMEYKAKVPDILNGQDSYNEQVIGKENNNIKTAEEVFYENQQKFSKKPLDLTDINQQLEISMNIDQFKELLIVV
ncbi:uncharacterized protein OCT59_022588 [Rhizophagus irregularis]|nr:hypothetical protein OCT59_022588 [Rhizophagus irregularis]GBC50904.2 hypothetical protein GLOIN_2v1476191 [Rhizophagus irregularis DAOM 181602=DAOM 197198]